MARKIKDNPTGGQLVKYGLIGIAAYYGYKLLVKPAAKP